MERIFQGLRMLRYRRMGSLNRGLISSIRNIISVNEVLDRQLFIAFYSNSQQRVKLLSA